MHSKEKLLARYFEESANILSAGRLPLGSNLQDQMIKGAFKTANKLRSKAGLPTKQYVIINRKSEMEIIK